MKLLAGEGERCGGGCCFTGAISGMKINQKKQWESKP
jgi:hypothetical protein